jgi:hypothetical protein
MSQRANCLTIRDEDGDEIATAYVGSQAMTWRDRTGPLRSMRNTALQAWIGEQVERIAIEGGDQATFLDQVVTVRDEYSY